METDTLAMAAGFARSNSHRFFCDADILSLDSCDGWPFFPPDDKLYPFGVMESRPSGPM